ncbi:hypothetical protein BDN67DRAFT_694280 [Paxillus ammoniavirescens]|nr:hypothetical protein BDN67DRAFT_694280 [Paxillus ammoniavirescens]
MRHVYPRNLTYTWMSFSRSVLLLGRKRPRTRGYETPVPCALVSPHGVHVAVKFIHCPSISTVSLKCTDVVCKSSPIVTLELAR